MNRSRSFSLSRSRSPRLTFASAVAAASLIVACGGGSSPSPSAPTPSPTPPPTTPSATGWTVQGRIVSGAGEPVANATITFDAGTARSGPDGAFTFTNANAGAAGAGPAAFKATVQADGYVPRELHLNAQPRSRDGIVIDLIRDAAPFSMAFYRELARNGYEEPNNLWPTRQWTANPNFYIETVDRAGRPVEAEVLAVVRAALPRAVNAFTNGVLAAGRIEEGASRRAEAAGWITVYFIRDMQAETCGRALIGSSPGWIEFNVDRCNCGSVKVTPATVAHEVGHAMGFWHVGKLGALMYAKGTGASRGDSRCSSGELSPDEQLHSAIAYRRARGNADPDRDPASGAFLRAPDSLDGAPVIVVD